MGQFTLVYDGTVTSCLTTFESCTGVYTVDGYTVVDFMMEKLGVRDPHDTGLLWVVGIIRRAFGGAAVIQFGEGLVAGCTVAIGRRREVGRWRMLRPVEIFWS